VLLRIKAEETARKTREVRTRLATPLPGALLTRLGANLPFGESAGEAILHCPAGKVGELCDWLTQNGAAVVTVSTLAYVFKAENPLFELLSNRIS
jgi:hypothetical protein